MLFFRRHFFQDADFFGQFEKLPLRVDDGTVPLIMKNLPLLEHLFVGLGFGFAGRAGERRQQLSFFTSFGWSN
jgi:hypothetical protein